MSYNSETDNQRIRIMPAQRCQFISIQVYAQIAVNKNFSMFDIANEVARVPANSGHVSNPLKPVSVFGPGVEQLHEYVAGLAEIANGKTETYARRGKGHETATQHVRAVSKARPLLISAVASYPEPDVDDTPERRLWIDLTISFFKKMYDKRLYCAVLHVDESFAHLHLFADCAGQTVKGPGGHPGHAAAEAEPDKALKGVAFRSAMARFQDDYHAQVGGPMGWLRSSPKPGLRTSRSVAMRERQRAQEELSSVQEKISKQLKVSIAEVAAAQLQINERRAQLAQLKKDLRDDAAMVARMKAVIVDQRALEERLAREAGSGADYWY